MQRLGDSVLSLSDFAFNAFENGEYFAETIQKQAYEAIGEVVEAMGQKEKDIVNEVKR